MRLRDLDPIDTVVNAVVAVGLAGWVVLWLNLTGACGSPQRPTVAFERPECLAAPPPTEPLKVFAEACPNAEWAACFSRESFVELYAYISKLKTYAHDAHTKCGTIPKE